jgi:hypothetical protein
MVVAGTVEKRSGGMRLEFWALLRDEVSGARTPSARWRIKEAGEIIELGEATFYLCFKFDMGSRLKYYLA